MPNSPRDRRNRKGCFIILTILYLLVSFNSKPANSVESNIQIFPAPAH